MLSLDKYTPKYKLKFGKHKGVKLADLPDHYIIWGLQNLDVMTNEPLRAEYQRRHNTTEMPYRPNKIKEELARKKIQKMRLAKSA